MRVIGRDPEHGGDWGYGEPELKCGAYAVAVWDRGRGWGQGACEVSDGVHGEHWGLASDVGAGRTGQGSESGDCNDWIVVIVDTVSYRIVYRTYAHAP